MAQTSENQKVDPHLPESRVHLAIRPRLLRVKVAALLLSLMEIFSSSDLAQLLSREVDAVSSLDSLSVMVHFMCQLGGVKGHPSSW